MGLPRLIQSAVIGLTIFAVQPSTSNYMLYDYGFGNGGGTSGTSNYSIEGISGELSGLDMSTVNYGLRSGLLATQLANVPTITLSNPTNSNNTLLVVIGTESNPSDARYAIAISDDNWVTTKYVQSDATVGASLGFEDYLTYSGWGSASGTLIVGLTSNTSYQVKARAFTGNFTETGYGPTSSAATSNNAITLDFDIDVSSSNTETAPPYSISFGDLLPDTVTDSPSYIWIDLSTNATSGGRVFVLSTNGGLNSVNAGYTISSATGNLSSLSEGFGAQGVSVTQTSGGPLSIDSPYNGTLNSVGIIDTTFRSILSTGASIDGGRSSIILKARATVNTPSATDYADTYTIVAAASF